MTSFDPNSGNLVMTPAQWMLGVDPNSGNLVMKSADGMITMEWTLKQAIDFHRNFGQCIEKAQQLIGSQSPSTDP